MTKCKIILLVVLIMNISMVHAASNPKIGEIIDLPQPKDKGDISVERALKKRRSVREYSEQPLQLDEVSQLLWAAQGITGSYGMRTAPSAGALYPIEIYLVAASLEGLPAGVYKYGPRKHQLQRVLNGDQRKALARAALGQECVADGAVSIVIAAFYDRTTIKYGERGLKYVHIEVGAVAENIYLQAESLKFGTVLVGAFRDEMVKELLKMDKDEEPLAIMPVGKKRK